MSLTSPSILFDLNEDLKKKKQFSLRPFYFSRIILLGEKQIRNGTSC